MVTTPQCIFCSEKDINPGSTILSQHHRIVQKRSSDGFSPWFLLLGCLSTYSSFLNLVILQWPVIQCCKVVSAGLCLESTLGIAQLGVQVIMFHLIFVLYMIYFPPYKKVSAFVHNMRLLCLPSRSFAWSFSLLVSKIILGHILISTLFTMLLLSVVDPPNHQHEKSAWLLVWAGFLGMTSTFLAMIQYIPQIIETYLRKSVGALSIPMMLMQTPGAILLAVSLALRPGANWTTWIVYAVTALLQATLLIMCLFYHVRAKRLGYSSFDSAESAPLLAVHRQSTASFFETTTTDNHEDEIRYR
ncbi:hypothetical protein BGZ72_009329 [Mortierella alpina]|nr:hypothetical protein BGZ72_009329 [Mortierella alpina]